MLELTRGGAARRPLPERAPDPALGWPEAARRDRPRVRRVAARRRLRRADLGARRLGAGGHPQPARRAAGARERSYVFISHDLGVVRYLSDRIAVLYLGRLMELGPAEVVFDVPHHPYTEALLSAVATIDGERERIRLAGEIPSAANPPTGCVFHTRCPRYLGAICDEQEPPLVEVEPEHADALPHPARGAPTPADRRPAASARADAADDEDTRGGAARRWAAGSRSPSWTWTRRTRARRSCASTRAASATPTTTRSTARRPRRAPPCSATRARASSRRSGAGVTRVRAGTARRALVGAVVRSMRGVPARPARTSAPRHGPRWARAV